MVLTKFVLTTPSEISTGFLQDVDKCTKVVGSFRNASSDHNLLSYCGDILYN
jgi:hypothetical protein